MLILKQSTASQAVLIGPFVDDSDGVTAETALTIDAADIRLSKNGGNMAAKNSGGGTHDENGWYTITLDATDTDTVGRLQISVAESGALPVFMECQVVEEAVYDALFAASATGIPSAGTIADAVWDEAVSGHTTNGTYGKAFSGATNVYIAGIAGTLNTLDQVDASQDIQHLVTVNAIAAVQNDLDTITDAGVALATSQPNYAPAKAGDAMTLANGAITNASLAGNMEKVFETDFATNYTATNLGWVTYPGGYYDQGQASNQAWPDNLSSLGINGSGHLSRVTLVDTTTTNTDMRGTDSAATATALAALVTTVGVAGAGLTEAGGTGDHLTGISVTVEDVTVGGFTQAALAELVTDDTGLTSATDGSVAKIAQGAAGGNVTVEAFTGDAATQLDAMQGSLTAIGGAVEVTVASVVAENGDITITRGDDYAAADGRALTWTGTSADIWPDLTDATIAFKAELEAYEISATGAVVTPTGTQVVRVELADTDTSSLADAATERQWKYDLQATLSSNRVITLARGQLLLRRDYA